MTVRSRGRRPAALGFALALGLAPGALFVTSAGASPVVAESQTNARGTPDRLPVSLGPFLGAYPNGIVIVTGTLAAGDTDFFALNLNAGQLLLVSLFDDRGGELTDTRIGVFQESVGASDPNIPPVAENDDGGPGFLSRLAVPIPVSGSWKVGLTGARDASYLGAHFEGRDAPVPYRLVIAVMPNVPSYVESDPAGGGGTNADPATPDALPVGGAVVRGSLDRADRDFFGLPAATGDELLASIFDFAPGGTVPDRGERNDTRLSLFRAGTLPQNGLVNDDGGPGFLSNVRLVVPLAQGGAWRVGLTGFRDAGFQGEHFEGPFGYALVVAKLAAPVDSDGDSILDSLDNCPYTANPGQEDVGGLGNGSGPDGIGNACQCGDVNGDGRVTIADSISIQRALLVPPTLVLAKPALCDVNGDGRCTIADGIILRRALLAPPTATVQQLCAPAVP